MGTVDKTILFFDGFDEVRNSDGKVIFSTKLDDELSEETGRINMDSTVVEIVVSTWNVNHDLMEVDDYLLDEGKCSQDEREIIIESLAYSFPH